MHETNMFEKQWGPNMRQTSLNQSDNRLAKMFRRLRTFCMPFICKYSLGVLPQLLPPLLPQDSRIKILAVCSTSTKSKLSLANWGKLAYITNSKLMAQWIYLLVYFITSTDGGMVQGVESPQVVPGQRGCMQGNVCLNFLIKGVEHTLTKILIRLCKLSLKLFKLSLIRKYEPAVLRT